MKRYFTSFGALAVLWLNIATAQIIETKLTASDGDALDFFGLSVSISGDYAIIGAPMSFTGVPGSTYIFKHEGASWSQQAKLIPSDGAAGDQFGWSVSIAGESAIVGSPENNQSQGAAYIFKRDGVTWREQAKLGADDGNIEDFFGTSVTISGDLAIVGAPRDDDNGEGSGSAYIFKRDAANPSVWTQQAKLNANDGEAEDVFGISVAIDEGYAIVGAPNDDDIDNNSGSAYIFRLNGTQWSQLAKLTAGDGTADDAFGFTVSIAGEHAVIGAFLADDKGENSGSAYIFKRDGAAWTQQSKLTASDGTTNDNFGRAVSISSNSVIIGAPNDDENGGSSGSAYIFTGNESGWERQVKLTASDGAAEDVYGWSVSIADRYAIVGAYLDDDNGSQSGAAYVYKGFSSPTSVEEDNSGIPTTFSLKQNYPNPFNPKTTIEFEVPKSSKIVIKIYNMLGQEIKTLVDDFFTTGVYSVVWDGLDYRGKNASSGLYFYKMKAEDFIKVKKGLLIK